MKGPELTLPNRRQSVPKRAVACLAWGFITLILQAASLPVADWPQFRGPARDGPAQKTVVDNTIYLLGCLGKLTAYRASDGVPVWSVDFVKDLGGRLPPWG